MRKMILVIMLVFSVGIITQLYSQDFIVKHNPEYILPSAEAISRIKLINRPSGLSTGIPNITIPLWNNGMCSYAINLNYYAGGIQVNELASSVGLGWSLNAGGAIYRVVQGLPDNLVDSGYINVPSQVYPLYNNDLDEYTNVNAVDFNSFGKIFDPAPDIFYYDFNGYKGKFVFNQSGEITLIPKANLLIKAEYTLTGEISSFTIRTSSGVTYNFDVPEIITINSYDGINSSSAINLSCLSYNSAWHLEGGKTISKGVISYEYNTVATTQERELYEYEYFNEEGSLVSDILKVNLTIGRQQLKSISDVNSVAKFNYDNDNYNELTSIEVTGVYPNNTPTEMTEISNIQFNYDEFVSTSTNEERKRKLSSVKFGRNSETGIQNGYTFTYNSLDLPPENSRAQDLWGYYNGSSATSLLPELNYDLAYYESIDLNLPNISGVSRDVNSNYIQAGMLEKIENPQGGVTEYVYEPHEFEYNNQTVMGGGVRIKSINKYKDANSGTPESTVNYTYTNFEDSDVSTGVLISKPNFAYNMKHYTDVEKQTFHYANFSYGLNTPFGKPVYYSQVTVDNNGLGYSVKSFELPIPNESYDNLIQDFEAEANLDSIGFYTDINFKGKEDSTSFCYGFNQAYLVNEKIFDSDNIIISQTNFHYKDIQDLDMIYGFTASPNMIMDYGDSIKNTLTLHKYFHSADWKLMDWKENISYVNGEQINNKVTTFSYIDFYSNYKIIEEIGWNDSQGYPHIKRFNYASSYPGIDTYGLNNAVEEYNQAVEDVLTNGDYREYLSDGETYLLKRSINTSILPVEQISLKNANKNALALSTMFHQNNISTPVEVVELVEINGVQKIVSATLKTFKKLPNQSVVPDREFVIQGPVDYDESDNSDIINDEFVFSDNYKFLREYSSYNIKGDLTTKTDESGIETTYEWSEQGNYLNSKTINSTHTISYEYKPLVGITSVTDVTGNKSYNIYDTQGNLVAELDNDKNIRKIYKYNSVNSEGSQEIDEDTDPDGVYTYTSTLNATLLYNIARNEFQINFYNPVFEYEIDFGDGCVEIVNQNTIIHPYTEIDNYTVTLKVRKNGLIYKQIEITASVSNL